MQALLEEKNETAPVALPTLRLEAWLKRDGMIVRLYGRRQASLPAEVFPGLIRLVLQPVEKGLVLAWRPLMERWVSEDDALKYFEAMKADGWVATKRPIVTFHDIGTPNAADLHAGGVPAQQSVAWEREMTRRKVAEAALRLKPGEFERKTDAEKAEYRSAWEEELRRKQEFSQMMGMRAPGTMRKAS